MKISETYTLSDLTKNPKTRSIVLKHLNPVIVDEQQLLQVHATLKNLEETNMGGGIPYKIMEELVAELDAITEPIATSL